VTARLMTVSTKKIDVHRVEVHETTVDLDFHRVELIFGGHTFVMNGPDAQVLGQYLVRAGGGDA
jgi:hypothetical protein